MRYVLDISRIQLPTDSSQSIRSSDDNDQRASSEILSIGPTRRNPRQQQFSPELGDIKPLAKLQDTELNSSKSYLPPYKRLTNTTTSSSETSSSSKLAHTAKSPTAPSAPPGLLTSSSYQEAFDDYIPPTPVHNLPKQYPTQPSVSNSCITEEPITQPLEPVINNANEHSCEVVNNSSINSADRKNSDQSSVLSLNSFSQNVHIVSPPHEIGPHDTINNQARIVSEKPSQTKIYYNSESERELKSSTLPGLLCRQDTISTASSAGLVDDPFQNMTASIYRH